MSTQILCSKFSHRLEKIKTYLCLLSTGTSDVLVLIEALPEFIDRRPSRFSSDVKQDTNYGDQIPSVKDTRIAWNHAYGRLKHTVGVNQGSKCIEEPPVTVQFLLVLLFQAKDDLHRACALRDFAFLGHHDM